MSEFRSLTHFPITTLTLVRVNCAVRPSCPIVELLELFGCVQSNSVFFSSHLCFIQRYSSQPWQHPNLPDQHTRPPEVCHCRPVLPLPSLLAEQCPSHSQCIRPVRTILANDGFSKQFCDYDLDALHVKERLDSSKRSRRSPTRVKLSTSASCAAVSENLVSIQCPVDNVKP
jgi:hypothetical protein